MDKLNRKTSGVFTCACDRPLHVRGELQTPPTCWAKIFPVAPFYALYYIENWSLLLDLKILILTIFRGFGQPHAY